MDEQRFMETIRRFAEKLPKFPDGRIDYTESDIAPVVTVFIKYDEKFLLMKRSDKVRIYQGKWGTVAGHLDELKPIKYKILEEIREEIGVSEDGILSIRLGEEHIFKDIEINKTWIIYPALAELKAEPKITLDWEHTSYEWIRPEELKNFDVFPKLEVSLGRVLV